MKDLAVPCELGIILAAQALKREVAQALFLPLCTILAGDESRHLQSGGLTPLISYARNCCSDCRPRPLLQHRLAEMQAPHQSHCPLSRGFPAACLQLGGGDLIDRGYCTI